MLRAFTIVLSAFVAAIIALPTSRAAEPAVQTKRAIAAAKQVDTLLTEELASAQSGAPAKDEVFLRRLYLDLIGQNPTPNEITAFTLDPSADKRLQVVNRLLDDARFGENWGRYWRDVMMYRRTDDRGQIAGPALTEYLTEQFNKNTSWDEIARSFITATGDVRENGATGLIMAQFGNTADITSEVARIFLGIQLQCANCHDHKTDRWKRTQFHQLAAFFPRIAVRPVNTDDKRSFQVVGLDRQRPRAAMQAMRPVGSLEHYMPDLKHPESQGTKMEPVFFLTNQRLPDGQPDSQRRATLAQWITAPSDQWFAKAFINRIWGELVGAGFYDPIDDLGPDRTCTAPKTLDYLTHEFIGTKYDIKQLYRIIANTAAYQRESRPHGSSNDSAVACNCPQRLRGDELFDALITALGIPDGTFAGAGRQAILRSPRGQFDQLFGYDPSLPRDEISGTIPQALLLMNGPQINRAINGNRPNSELGKLLSSTNDNESVTVELYLRCLGREPTKDELLTCLNQVKQSNSRTEAFEDIQWALINSTEFLHRK